MSGITVKGSGRKLLTSFESSLGVGSSWVSSPFDMSMFKTLVGICQVESADLTIQLEQSATNSPWDVASTVAHTPGTTLVDWTGYGQYGQVSISAVNSSQGKAIRLHVFGVPI